MKGTTQRRAGYALSKIATIFLRTGLLATSISTSACAFNWTPEFNEQVDLDNAFRDVQISPPSEALTFARTKNQRVIIVRSYVDRTVEGIDVSAILGSEYSDPIALYEQLGYAALEELINESETWNLYAESELDVPLPLLHHHLAAGTNYPEHAGETGVERPFMFPKLVEATAWDGPVQLNQGLLDYEVELCFVPLSPIAPGEFPEEFGLLLANDFSRRDVLLRLLDPSDVESGKGFTTAKSFPGFLPVGNLFVIPRTPREYANDVQLTLYVNGQLRQRALHSVATWNLDEILRQSWARVDTRWDHRGQPVSLFPHEDGRIPARTLIMTGTPSGVVFNEINTEQRASALLDWLGGNWGDTLPDRAIADYITDAQAAGIYLLPQDVVDIHVAGLGRIRTEVEQ